MSSGRPPMIPRGLREDGDEDRADCVNEDGQFRGTNESSEVGEYSAPETRCLVSYSVMNWLWQEVFAEFPRVNLRMLEIIYVFRYRETWL
jgi:hypothetical protein